MATNTSSTDEAVYTPKRGSFNVNLNNLVTSEMIDLLLDELEDSFIEHLNEVLSSVKFLVGGNQRESDKAGVVDFSVFEYDCRNKELRIFLYSIFTRAFNRWQGVSRGAFKRYIWDSFCHEVLLTLAKMSRINPEMIADMEGVNFSRLENELEEEPELHFQRFQLLDRLFSRRMEEKFPRADYISINQKLWKNELPRDLGFFNVLYERKLKELKKSLNGDLIEYKNKILVFNELRKLKLGYKYEYNLSELVNYVIQHKNFKDRFHLHDWHFWGNLRREFYYKAKRRILNFFKQYEIMDELKEYKDSANRTHYFLTHSTFERVKSACLQNCLATIKNKRLEDYITFREFYMTCPLCKQYDVNQFMCQEIYFTGKFNYFKRVLLERMASVDSLEELNNEKIFFGVPCEECFTMVKNITGKYSDLDDLQRFILNYSECPVCRAKNEPSYLAAFYHDETQSDLRNALIHHMLFGDEASEKFGVKLGIPCCKCFREIFHEDPEASINFSLF